MFLIFMARDEFKRDFQYLRSFNIRIIILTECMEKLPFLLQKAIIMKRLDYYRFAAS